MSNISIKKDFADGDILPAADLNNNFRVIEAGINANDEQLEQIIEQAITRLDAELIAITADRGWDWNGGDRVTFFKGTTTQVNNQAIKNGQLLYNISTGETSLDDDGERIVTGSGNVIAIDDEEPENPATKLWINPDEPLQNIGTEVVNSMSGNETTMAPSVSAVKDYVKDVYSTSEFLTNKTWSGLPVYRKQFVDTLSSDGYKQIANVLSSDYSIRNIEGVVYQADGTVRIIPFYFEYEGTGYYISCFTTKTTGINIELYNSTGYGDLACVITLEYTKS